MDIEVNDIVQIVPEHKWAGSFAIVTEVKKWGVQGYVPIPMEGQAYIRLKFKDIEKVGRAIFVLGEEE
jgi:hypothetical protein